MFSQASVCPRGEGVGQTPPEADTPRGRDPPLEATPTQRQIDPSGTDI